jgi:SAM-dependent methyltransferase
MMLSGLQAKFMASIFLQGCYVRHGSCAISVIGAMSNLANAMPPTAPTPLDGVLFSLSYNTMPHHRRVLRKAWNRLRPGGRVVIMDAKLPPGRGGEMILPFSLWLMKRTMLGNPLIQPWTEIVARTEHFNMREYLFASYYICCGMKPSVGDTATECEGASRDIANMDDAYRIAAE